MAAVVSTGAAAPSSSVPQVGGGRGAAGGEAFVALLASAMAPVATATPAAVPPAPAPSSSTLSPAPAPAGEQAEGDDGASTAPDDVTTLGTLHVAAAPDAGPADDASDRPSDRLDAPDTPDVPAQPVSAVGGTPAALQAPVIPVTSSTTPGSADPTAGTPPRPVDATVTPRDVATPTGSGSTALDAPARHASGPAGAAPPTAAVAAPTAPVTSAPAGGPGAAAPAYAPVPLVVAPAAPPAAATASAPPPVPGTPFVAQLSRPVLGLAAAAPGQHVLTVRVSPEHLGPVTVQAHIGADGVRIELFSPTDAGRAAVHAVLADLRRDLAATGLGASLDVSDRGAPLHDPTPRHGQQHAGDGGAQGGLLGDAGGGRRRDGPGPTAVPTAAAGPRAPGEAPPGHPSPARPPSSARLDVIA